MNNHTEIHQVDRLDESRKGCNYVTNLQTHTHTPAKVFASKVLRLGLELLKMPYPELVLLVLDFARIAVDESVQTGEDAETCAAQGQVQTTDKHLRLSKAALG